jgi:quinol monooxygenase YgiN
MAEHYASGVWQVKEGKDEEFVERWKEFLQWSRANHPSMVVANLLRDRGTTGHYLSFSEWSDAASRDAWKQDPGFKTHIGACVALCENMHGADYDLAATV